MRLPIRCACGRIWTDENGHLERLVSPDQSSRSTGNSAICRRGECSHYNAAVDTCGLTITIGRAKGQNRSGRVGWLDSHPNHPCPEDPGRFGGNGFGGRVGFLAVAYSQIGGTEIWHHTLLSRLGDVAGFVCIEPTLCGGDRSRLPCPSGVGIGAAKILARSCRTLVVWGAGERLGEILGGTPAADRPRVISVTHCDGTSGWSTRLMHSQAPWTDHNVYLCPSAVQSCPAGIPATLIPNAPDPARVIPEQGRKVTREALGLSDSDRLLLVTARLSPEKRLDLLMDAVHLLPPNYHFVIAGKSGGHSTSHAASLQKKTSDRIRIVDPVESPGDLLAAADAVLAASEYEGYGLATAEALLAGVPVIATPVGLLESNRELARLVHHGATPREWADAILADFANEGWRQKRIALARQVMETQHSVERFVGSWKDLIG